MRVVLVGSPTARAALRARLHQDLEVVGEYDTAEAARTSGANVDAVVLAPDTLRTDASERRTDGGGLGEPDVVQETLTAREAEVLALVATGLSNRGIAERLGISDQTVKFHVAAIMGKLGTRNRVETVRRAVRRGLVTI